MTAVCETLALIHISCMNKGLWHDIKGIAGIMAGGDGFKVEDCDLFGLSW